MGQDVRVPVRGAQFPYSHPQGDLRGVNFKAGEYSVSSILHHMSSLKWRGDDTHVCKETKKILFKVEFRRNIF